MTELPRGVRIAQWNSEKLLTLWTHVKDYAKLFSDDTRGDVEDWTRKMTAPDTVVFEFGEGLLILEQLRRGLKATVHAIFFDKKLRVHSPLVRETIAWVFREYNLHRLSAEIPTFSKALRRWLVTDLGFQVEGVMRNDFWYAGELKDSVMLSLLREEVLHGE